MVGILLLYWLIKSLMKNDGDSLTHLSLLERLGDADRRQEAWSEFLDRYIKMILGWCRFWGVSDADAEEVLQETVLAVYRGFQGFDRQGPGSFRAWLKTVARNNWTRVAQCRRRDLGKDAGSLSDAELSSRIENQEARDHLFQLFEEWATREILDLAMSRVRSRVESSSWRVFEMLTFENRSVEETAEALKTSSRNVYLIIFRIRKMIAAEMAILDPQN